MGSSEGGITDFLRGTAGGLLRLAGGGGGGFLLPDGCRCKLSFELLFKLVFDALNDEGLSGDLGGVIDFFLFDCGGGMAGGVSNGGGALLLVGTGGCITGGLIAGDGLANGGGACCGIEAGFGKAGACAIGTGALTGGGGLAAGIVGLGAEALGVIGESVAPLDFLASLAANSSAIFIPPIGGAIPILPDGLDDGASLLALVFLGASIIGDDLSTVSTFFNFILFAF